MAIFTSSHSAPSQPEIQEQDLSQALTDQVKTAFEQTRALQIQGSGSKHFLGYPVQGELLSVAAHRGIVNYQPSELTLSVRCGTPLQQVKEILAEKKQMLAFEPPGFSESATLGGVIACGLSGPSRPFYGAARDFVLGCRIINGRGEALKFGGEVMKNVAGYDLSRLMTGAQGTLGVLLDISLKVLPLPPAEITLKLPVNAKSMLETIRKWTFAGHPVSAACHTDDSCYIRLSGSNGSVRAAQQQIQQQLGGEEVDNDFWTQLNEQTQPFFTSNMPLWRISLPMASDDFEQQCPFSRQAPQIIDWAGALRWIATEQPAADIFLQLRNYGGHAQLFSTGKSSAGKRMAVDNSHTNDRHQPLAAGLFKLHQRLKEAMDPEHILNPGRIYADL